MNQNNMLQILTVFFFLIQFILSDIDVFDMELNKTVRRCDDADARFGNRFEDMVQAFVVIADPELACGDHIDPPPVNYSNYNMIFVALIKRGNCTFDHKVYTAQQSNYLGAIIYNDQNDDVFPMQKSPKSKFQVMIPSKMIGFRDGCDMKHTFFAKKRRIRKLLTQWLLQPRKPQSSVGQTPLEIHWPYMNGRRYFVSFTNFGNFNPQLYIIAFLAFVSMGFFIIGVGFGVKLCRDVIKRRANRLRKSHLRKIPQKKFVKGVDTYETCAICLDDYSDGDKLRILPCFHAYHSACIDPWLLRQRRNCPICKQRIRIPGYIDRDEDPDDTPAVTVPVVAGSSTLNVVTEQTPLLTAAATVHCTDHNDGETVVEQPGTHSAATDHGYRNLALDADDSDAAEDCDLIRDNAEEKKNLEIEHDTQGTNTSLPSINNYANDIVAILGRDDEKAASSQDATRLV